MTGINEIKTKKVTMYLRRITSQRRIYETLPFKEWDGITPLALFQESKWFFSKEELDHYIDTNKQDPKDIMLEICEPHYAQECRIESGYFEDIMAEDMDLRDYPELEEAVNEFNKKVIAFKEPLSWSGCGVRTEYKRAR